MKIKSTRDRESGKLDIIIIVLITLALVGGLAYLGYNTYTKQNASSASEQSRNQLLNEALAKIDSGDVFALTDQEKSAIEESDTSVAYPSDKEIQVAQQDRAETRKALPKIQSHEMTAKVVDTAPSNSKKLSDRPTPTTTDKSYSTLKKHTVYSTGSTNLPAYRTIVEVNNTLWFTNANTPYIGNISTKGELKSYRSKESGYFGAIAKGSDNRIWYAGSTRKIHAMTLDGKETTYPVPSRPAQIEDLLLGPDGNVWFTTWGASRGGVIGKITPTGSITEYSLGLPFGDARGLAVGSDNRIWFGTNLGSGAITTNGKVTLYNAGLGGGKSVYGLTHGTSGNIWMILHDGSDGATLVRFDKNGQPKSYYNEDTKRVFRLFTGPNGDIWVSEKLTGRIGKLSNNGTIKWFPGPKGLENAYGIAFINGNPWVSYATPLTDNEISAPGKIVEFSF